MLGEVADVHVVACAELPRRELTPAGEGLDQRRLARAIGPHERDVLATLEPDLGVLEQDNWIPARSTPARPSHLDLTVEQLEDHLARALWRLEGELEPLAIPRVTLDSVDLAQRLYARLRLFGLGCLVAEALDEALHPLDLGLLLVDRLAERDLARGLLAAPLMPGSGKETRTAGL